MERKLRVYLAGPEVFLPDARALGESKKRLCLNYGFEGLYPFDNDIASDAAGTRRDLLIYRANMAMMRAADLGVFNLTPFRGPSADVGTVYELGVMVALDKRVFGYTNEDDDLLTRVRRRETVLLDSTGQTWRDSAGMAVEDFANADNLMIDSALAERGGGIVRRAARPEGRFHDLAAFEACLKRATESATRSATIR